MRTALYVATEGSTYPVLEYGRTQARCHIHCRANLQQISQSRPDSGPDLSHVKYESLEKHLIDSKLVEGTTRAEDAQGSPTQSYISPSLLVYDDKLLPLCLGPLEPFNVPRRPD